MHSIKRYMFIIAGSVLVALGFAGVFVPLLPTTPFLLLSAFCYMKSSTRMYNWLIHHKIVGPIIYSYITYKSIPLKIKIGSVVILWATLIISMLLMSSPHVKILLIIVGIGVTVHLLYIKTMSDEDMNALDDAYRGQYKSEPDRQSIAESDRFEE